MDAAEADKLLREKGFMTRKTWALQYGHSPYTVNTTFRRWLGQSRPGVPRSEGAKILEDLKLTLDKRVLEQENNT